MVMMSDAEACIVVVCVELVVTFVVLYTFRTNEIPISPIRRPVDLRRCAILDVLHCCPECDCTRWVFGDPCCECGPILHRLKGTK